MQIYNLLTLKKDTYYLLDTMTIRQAMEKFDFHKFSAVPIINDKGEYLSTISEGDILRFIKNEKGFDISKAENINIMEIKRNREYQSKKIDDDIKNIFKLAMSQNFIPVVDDRNMFIGIVKRSKIIENYIKK